MTDALPAMRKRMLSSYHRVSVKAGFVRNGTVRRMGAWQDDFLSYVLDYYRLPFTIPKGRDLKDWQVNMLVRNQVAAQMVDARERTWEDR